MTRRWFDGDRIEKGLVIMFIVFIMILAYIVWPHPVGAGEFSDIGSSNSRENNGNSLKMISNPNKGDEDKIVTGAIVVIGLGVAAIIYLRRENS